MNIKPLYEFDEDVRDLLIRSHLEGRFRAKIIGIMEGAFGQVYRLDLGAGTHPRYLAAKCPKFTRFSSPEKAVVALEGFLHEVEKTYRLLACPWVNRFTDIYFVAGWPFLISRWNDGTLADLIANPLVWTQTDRSVSLIQIIRALRKASEKGISAHQDLKPENIFFMDVHRRFPGTKDSQGLHFHMLVADFGNADAFRDLGRNSGTRPYMAPEQFRDSPLDPSTGLTIDVFALGVIAHEAFCDGLHPIGEFTSDVWPQRSGVSRKWGEAKVWRQWAETKVKDLAPLAERCPRLIFNAVSAALSVDPLERPSLEEFEDSLWQTLFASNRELGEALQFQVEAIEARYTSDAWPHFEERLTELRSLYAERT